MAMSRFGCAQQWSGTRGDSFRRTTARPSTPWMRCASLIRRAAFASTRVHTTVLLQQRTPHAHDDGSGVTPDRYIRRFR
eukprot:126676-Prorocentrum_minimum.AAC.1